MRAKLIRVEPRRDAPSADGLNLASVAQDIVSRDDQHYTSLDKALEQALDILAPDGFTMGAAVTEVRRRTPLATTGKEAEPVCREGARHFATAGGQAYLWQHRGTICVVARCRRVWREHYSLKENPGEIFEPLVSFNTSGT